MNATQRLLLASAVFVTAGSAAAEIIVQMHAVSTTGTGDHIGVVAISEVTHGLEFTPDLFDLPPGEHGFHLHGNPSCEPAVIDGQPQAALAAGDHYDPAGSMKHGSALGDGHLGDLPVLLADLAGKSAAALQASRLSLADVRGRALVIHMGADNYSDEPEPAGGGGIRIACGVVH